MNISATRFLQEQVMSLQRENQAQQERITTLQRCIEALAGLYWTAQRVPDEKNLMGMLDRCLYDVMRAVGARDGSLAQLDQETGDLVFIIVHGELSEQLVGHRIKSDAGIAGWAFQNGEEVIVNNPHQDWRFSSQVDREFAFVTHSILCVPVRRDERPMGVIELVNKERDEFTRSDAMLALVLGHVAALILHEFNVRSGAQDSASPSQMDREDE